jgi:hypothetical protein
MPYSYHQLQSAMLFAKNNFGQYRNDPKKKAILVVTKSEMKAAATSNKADATTKGVLNELLKPQLFNFMDRADGAQDSAVNIPKSINALRESDRNQSRFEALLAPFQLMEP